MIRRPPRSTLTVTLFPYTTLFRSFLTDILGLSWADAHKEAGKWEHIISEPVENAIVRVLGDSTTCPHGNPIPGAAYVQPDYKALSALTVRGRFTVGRIPAEPEIAPRLPELHRPRVGSGQRVAARVYLGGRSIMTIPNNTAPNTPPSSPP